MRCPYLLTFSILALTLTLTITLTLTFKKYKRIFLIAVQKIFKEVPPFFFHFFISSCGILGRTAQRNDALGGGHQGLFLG
jgi:hypothetical protein